jgi:hypothetical protein
MREVVGQRCWAVAYGPNTWTNMSLKLGATIPRSRILARKTNPRCIRYLDSEYTLYIQGPWSLLVTRSGTQQTIEHSVDALEVAKDLLTDSTLLRASIVPGVGAEFGFQDKTTLVVHQQRLIGEDPVEAVLSVFFPRKYFVFTSDGLISWCQRESR